MTADFPAPAARVDSAPEAGYGSPGGRCAAGAARGGRGWLALIVIGGVVLGAILGAVDARRRGGRLADILHRALVGGIGLGLAGLIATVVIERLL